MALSDAQQEYAAALTVARFARGEWEKDPSDKNFRKWRDASDVAIKWHRATRLEGTSDSDNDDPFEEFDELAARRAA